MASGNNFLMMTPGQKGQNKQSGNSNGSIGNQDNINMSSTAQAAAL